MSEHASRAVLQKKGKRFDHDILFTHICVLVYEHIVCALCMSTFVLLFRFSSGSVTVTVMVYLFMMAGTRHM